MSVAPEEIEAAASALFKAEREGKQIGLLSRQFRLATMDDAYAIQASLIKRKLAAGREIIGWKIGLTSKAMQQSLGINTPDSGVLLDDMLFESGASIPPGRYIQPRVEAEIAFIMKDKLEGPGIGREDVMSATHHVAPALEILDTRIVRTDSGTGASRTIVDTIADNAANAGIVLGAERHDPQDFDLRWVGAILFRNEEVEETGLGAGVLNDPASGIAWLANRLAQYGGIISPGNIVLSGSFVRAVETRHGDSFLADFGRFGSAACKFL